MRLDFTYRKSNEWYRNERLPEWSESAFGNWQHDIFSFLKYWFSDKKVFEIRTSGTTGAPKTEYFSRESLVASAEITINTFGLSAGDTLLMCLPIKFVAGKMMLVRAITGKMHLLALEPKTNPIDTLNEPVDFAAFTPHQLQNIIRETPEKLNLIKKIIIGGSPVKDSLLAQLSDFNSVFYETYGMSETLTHIAIRQLNGENKSKVFKVLKGFVIDVNQAGCLSINAGHLPNSPIVTSDIVEIVKPGYFNWIGRANDIINSGGIKLIPSLIEKKIGSIIDSDFIIAAQNDSDLGEIVVLYIEGREPEKSELNFLKQRIAEKLNKYENPRKIVFMNAFPRNKNGKIIRSDIK